MTTIDIRSGSLVVALTRGEKVAGLLRDAAFPLTSVRSVEVVDDGLAAVRGLRAPGLGLPGRRMIGTWHGREGRTLVSVRRGHPALRVTLEGERYRRLLLDVDDATATAAALAAA